MVSTETFKNIHEKVKNEKTMILQCYGVPGSGKSEIIRKLAENFPFEIDSDETLVHIKWHIQCKDSGHNLQNELKILAEKLWKNSFIDQDKYPSIVDSLEENETRQLVEILVKINVPVLILVEDPPDEQIAILKNFCINLRRDTEQQKSTSEKIHLYISSRKNPALLETDGSIPNYKLEIVNGFNEQEALDYLQGQAKDEDEAKLAIFQFFGGLPLGLNAAKAFCKKARINYKKYLELVKDVEYNIISKERDAIMKEYGRSAQHVFQAIVVPFMPSDKDDTAAVLPWKILCCLSYFHYDRIPRYVLEQCCHVLREGKVKNPALRNEVDVGQLISELLDHSMCTETNKGEITFHEVVLNAFRLNRLGVLDDFNTLKNSIQIMCSLVSKDMRKKEHSLEMFKLRRHLQALLDHVENNKQIFENKNDELLLRAWTSYLHETAPAIMLGESPSLFWNECKEHFEKALSVLFPDDISEYTKAPENIQSAEQIACKILEMSKLKGSLLSPDFVVEYASKLQLSFADQPDELEFLKSRSINSQCFVKMTKLLSEKAPPEILIKMLQDCGLFLSNDSYRPLFYAERFAFILHSWSRLVLYGDPDDVKEIGKRCIWMSALSHEIAIECNKSCGVSLLAERLSITGGRIPILLKVKESPEALKNALSICEELLNNEVNAKTFENGLLREVYGPSSNDTRINLLRYIVRINAKVLKGASSDFVASADKRCEELFKLSEEHSKTIRICIMSIIYCAKYYAAKEDVNQALKCFEKFFELEPNCKPRFHVRCWAACNYARAVSKFENYTSEHVAAAFNKCKEVLEERDEMKKSVKEHLNSYMKDLDQKLKIRKRKLET